MNKPRKSDLLGVRAINQSVLDTNTIKPDSKNPFVIKPGDETIHSINQQNKEWRAMSGGGRFYQN